MPVAIYWMPNQSGLTLYLSLTREGAMWESIPAKASLFHDVKSAIEVMDFLKHNTKLFGIGMERFTGYESVPISGEEESNGEVKATIAK